MAIQTAEAPAGAGDPTIVDVRNGGRVNGSKAKPPPRSGQTKSAGGRPRWVSGLLAALAGGLALLGGWILLQSGEEAPPEAPSVIALYAVADLPAGTTVDAVIDGATSLLSARTVPIEFALPGSVTTVEELEPLRGQRLAGTIFAGTPVVVDRFVPLNDFEGESFIDRQSNIEAPAGHMKVALRLPPSRALGGSVAAGDTVAVLASFSRTENVDSITTLLLPAIEVIDVKGDRGVAEEQPTDELDPAVVIDDIAVSEFDITVAVTPQESTRLAYAIEHGKILLAVAVEGATYDDDRVADTLTTLLGRTDITGLDEQIQLEPLPTIEEPETEDAVTEDAATEDAATEDAATEEPAAEEDEASRSGGITNIAPNDEGTGE